MYKKFFFVNSLIIFSSLFSSDAPYEFYGRHFIASYKQCNEKSLFDTELLKNAFEKAVLASGATILSSNYEVFTGGGITITIVLSESHASIHTYPEHAACFVDLFTCGTHCHHEPFDEVLMNYLQPQLVDKNLIIRE